MILQTNDPLTLTPPSKYVERTGFVANVGASFETDFYEENTIAPYITEKEDFARRDNLIYKAALDGLFPEKILKSAHIPNRHKERILTRSSSLNGRRIIFLK